MSRSHHGIDRAARILRAAARLRAMRPAADRAVLWDVLLGAAAVAYILGFVAAIEAALSGLQY